MDTLYLYITYILSLMLIFIGFLKYELDYKINIKLLWNYLFIFTLALSIDELRQLYISEELMTARTFIKCLLLIFVDDVIVFILKMINYFVDKDYQKRKENFEKILNLRG